MPPRRPSEVVGMSAEVCPYIRECKARVSECHRRFVCHSGHGCTVCRHLPKEVRKRMREETGAPRKAYK